MNKNWKLNKRLMIIKKIKYNILKSIRILFLLRILFSFYNYNNSKSFFYIKSA